MMRRWTLADYLEEGHHGPWFHYDVAYSLFAFKGEKVNVVGYQSGKLVVSGKKTEDFVRDISSQITGEAKLGYDEVHNPEWFGYAGWTRAARATCSGHW